MPKSKDYFDSWNCWNEKDRKINKKVYASLIVINMLNRAQKMFKINGLPETIPEREMKKLLIENGFCVIDKVNDELYAFDAGLGGQPDVYYQPTIATIANPALNYSAQKEIGKDCVLIRFNSYMLGLLPIFKRYAMALTETDISIRMAKINGRLQSLISAYDGKTYDAALKYLQDLEDGKIGVIQQNFASQMTDTASVSAQPLAAQSSQIIAELIELRAYEYAEMLREIGLNQNNNMKRENISEDEADLNSDVLFPLIDEIKDTIQKGLDEMNAMFGTDCQLELDSTWENNEEQIDIELENFESNSDEEETTEDENDSNEDEEKGEEEDEE